MGADACNGLTGVPGDSVGLEVNYDELPVCAFALLIAQMLAVAAPGGPRDIRGEPSGGMIEVPCGVQGGKCRLEGPGGGGVDQALHGPAGVLQGCDAAQVQPRDHVSLEEC